MLLVNLILVCLVLVCLITTMRPSSARARKDASWESFALHSIVRAMKSGRRLASFCTHYKCLQQNHTWSCLEFCTRFSKISKPPLPCVNTYLSPPPRPGGENYQEIAGTSDWRNFFFLLFKRIKYGQWLLSPLLLIWINTSHHHHHQEETMVQETGGRTSTSAHQRYNLGYSSADSPNFFCSVIIRCISVLQCVAMCCSVLRCVAVCCSVLQCHHSLQECVVVSFTSTQQRYTLDICVYTYIYVSHVYMCLYIYFDILLLTVPNFSFLSSSLQMCIAARVAVSSTSAHQRYTLYIYVYIYIYIICIYVYIYVLGCSSADGADLFCSVIFRCRSVLRRVEVVLQWAVECCRVLQCVQCVAVHCRALQCVAVCCSVLRCVAMCCSVLQCVAVCCSVLQYFAVCCSVLQCDAVCAIPNILCAIIIFYNPVLHFSDECCNVS